VKKTAGAKNPKKINKTRKFFCVFLFLPGFDDKKQKNPGQNKRRRPIPRKSDKRFLSLPEGGDWKNFYKSVHQRHKNNSTKPHPNYWPEAFIAIYFC
jgi:hypothetical protein